MDDWHLLREYTDHGSETAFRTLVERHLPLVHSAAVRQVADPQLAEEISQTVFLLLARKARALPRGTVIAGWLFRTTRFVAQRAARGETRRRRREQEALDMQTLHTPDRAWDAMAPLLDEGLAHLQETDRHALLLRHFEHRPYREVGLALGLGEDAAKKRVARALDRLRAFLALRGVVVPAAVIGIALSDHAVHAAPPGTAASILTLAQASGPGATVTAGGPWDRVEDCLRAWRWARLQWTAAVTTGALVVVGLTAWFLPSTRPPASHHVASPAASTSLPHRLAVPRLARAAAPDTPPPQETRTLFLYVVDEATGRGIPEARIAEMHVRQAQWHSRDAVRTDSNGVAAVAFASDTDRLDVGSLTEGWGARYATFLPHADDPIPAEYTLRLQRAERHLGGRILDPDHRAVPDADIVINFASSGDHANRETPRERVGAPSWNVVIARSDAEGRWSSALLPPEHPGFTLEARHPDHPPTPILSVGAGRVPRNGLEGLPDGERDLWSGSLVTTLRRGFTLTGRVLTAEGRPVENALIAHEPQSIEPRTTRTDAEGRFRLAGLSEGFFDVVASAEGYAPEYREVPIGPDLPELELRLEPGAVLRLRVVDPLGAAVPGATVSLEQWGERRHKIDWSATSDAQGRITWDAAPAGDPLELCARKNGWCYSRNVRVTAGDDEHVIELRPAARVEVRVTDAVSGLPLAGFKAFPGYGMEDHGWERLATRHGTHGAVSVLFEENQGPWRVRVEAEGYEPFISPPFAPSAVDQPLAVALQRDDPHQAVRGIVLRPDGQPAAGIDVGLLTFEHNVQLGDRSLVRRGVDRWITRTDAQGRFAFAPNPQAHSVVAAGPEGFAREVFLRRRAPLTLRLEGWGRIEGLLDPAVRDQGVHSVWLDDGRYTQFRGHLILAGDHAHASPDTRGAFTFATVPPGDYALWISPGLGQTFRHRTPVRVLPDQPTGITLRPRGPTLAGRLLLPDSPLPAEARPQLPVVLTRTVPPPPPPRTMDFAGTLEAVEYGESPAGRAWATRGVHGQLRLAVDGSFATEDGFPPGDYRLEVHLPGNRIETILAVPESPEGVTHLDLGEIDLRPQR